MDSPYERCKAALTDARRRGRLWSGLAGAVLSLLIAFFTLAAVLRAAGVPPRGYMALFLIISLFAGWAFFAHCNFQRLFENAKKHVQSKTSASYQRILVISGGLGIISFLLGALAGFDNLVSLGFVGLIISVIGIYQGKRIADLSMIIRRWVRAGK